MGPKCTFNEWVDTITKITSNVGIVENEFGHREIVIRRGISHACAVDELVAKIQEMEKGK